MLNASFGKALAVMGFCLSAANANAAFHINLSFDANVADSYRQYFTTAETYWESIITGYRPGISLTGLSVSVSTPLIDGVGKVLGQAGTTVSTSQGGYELATNGLVRLDSADVTGMISNHTFESVIEHEMAHAIGFGTLWTDNRVYVDGSGRYTGVNALAAYRTEFRQSGATFVPVELAGGPGTANGHWAEVAGGAGPTGVVAGNRDMEYELMTGWVNAPIFVSRTTIASFADIGYTVSAVPEPETAWMYAIGLPLLLAIGARRKSPLAWRIRASNPA